MYREKYMRYRFDSFESMSAELTFSCVDSFADSAGICAIARRQRFPLKRLFSHAQCFAAIFLYEICLEIAFHAPDREQIACRVLPLAVLKRQIDSL